MTHTQFNSEMQKYSVLCEEDFLESVVTSEIDKNIVGNPQNRNRTICLKTESL